MRVTPRSRTYFDGRAGGGCRNGRRGDIARVAALGLPVAAVESAAGSRQDLCIARSERQEDQQEGADHLRSHRHRRVVVVGFAGCFQTSLLCYGLMIVNL